MLNYFRKYDSSRTDLRPGQPVVGGHKHAPHARGEESVSQLPPQAPKPASKYATAIKRKTAAPHVTIVERGSVGFWSQFRNFNPWRKPEKPAKLSYALDDDDDGGDWQSAPKPAQPPRANPKNVTEFIVWKVLKIGRPRQP